jgi:hypothetical protein
MKQLLNKKNTVCFAWITFIVIAYSVISIIATHQITEVQQSYLKRHHDRITPEDNERLTKTCKLNNESLIQVKTGAYIERIVEFSSKKGSWNLDFYVWFNWDSEVLKTLRDIQIVNGQINHMTPIRSESKGATGGRYELYKVNADITKYFNVKNYPLDSHLLTLRVEHKSLNCRQLQFKTDNNASKISSRISIPGYDLAHAGITSINHAYQSLRGAEDFADNHPVHSQILFGIKIVRPDFSLYIKIHQGLFASIFVALLVFLFSPGTSDRIHIGIGAFFAAVASSYFSLSELPNSGVNTFSDITNVIGLTTIIFSLLGSLIVVRVKQPGDSKHFIIWFDKLVLLVILGCYLLTNLNMLQTTMSGIDQSPFPDNHVISLGKED